MRVIAGKYRSIILQAPEGLQTRPTLDRVKEALFSILNFSIEKKVVLDLFAGSGALGIEALSRGAEFVYFNDNNKIAINIINKNLSNLKGCTNYTVSNLDAFLFIKNQEVKCDIVFLDPPYQNLIYEDIIADLIKFKRLTHDPIIVIECDKKNNNLSIIGFNKKVYNYGNKSLIILKKIT